MSLEVKMTLKPEILLVYAKPHAASPSHVLFPRGGWELPFLYNPPLTS